MSDTPTLSSIPARVKKKYILRKALDCKRLFSNVLNTSEIWCINYSWSNDLSSSYTILGGYTSGCSANTDLFNSLYFFSCVILVSSHVNNLSANIISFPLHFAKTLCCLMTVYQIITDLQKSVNIPSISSGKVYRCDAKQNRVYRGNF